MAVKSVQTRQQAAVARRAAKQRFRTAKAAEREYSKALTNVGRQVGNIISGYTTQNPLGNHAEMQRTLADYAKLIKPWAEAVTKRMHTEVGWRDLRAWKALSNQIGRSLTRELNTAPTGEAYAKLMRGQVALIQSLPIEAGQRVHDLTMEALTTTSARFDAIVPEILRSGQVTVGRAKMIARTETARTSSVLTQVRAEAVGSDSYIWRSSEDQAVRPDHRRLNGHTFKWNEPPIADTASGIRAHPGQIWNCRCYPEPIVP